MIKSIDYLYIAGTVCFTVYGQLILKWRITQFTPLPVDIIERVKYVFLLVLDPFIFSAFVAAFLASLSWMVAMTKFDLNYAYPFTSFTFVGVLLLSGWILHEPITLQKIIGVGLIISGTVVAAKS